MSLRSRVRLRRKKKTETLLILQSDGQNTRNSAGRVSEPRLAQIQYICGIRVGIEVFPTLLESSASAFRFNRVFSQARHMVYDTYRNAHVAAVANIWRRERAKTTWSYVLVVPQETEMTATSISMGTISLSQ